MSTNDWEKSWKRQLDKYDSPVDNSLFEAITSKASAKSGTPFFFGWIGLGFVLLSSILIIAGFNIQSNQSTGEAGKKLEIFQAAISEKKSGFEHLASTFYNPDVAYVMNNSGKYVSTSKLPTQKANATAPKNTKKVTSRAVELKSTSVPKKSELNQVTILQPEPVAELPVTENTFHPSVEPVIQNADIKFEDANVRLNAAEPVSVLFPVKSRVNSKQNVKLADPENCFNDARGRSSFYIDAFVGAGNSIRSLSAVENQGAYMHMRDSLEKSWYNSAAGARIGFILASGMAIETGAEYQVHNEIFEYRNESEIRITYKYHYDQFGEVTRIDTITEIGARTLRTNNKYQQITIPLRLGYTMEKGRWMLGARIGVGLHIWNHQHGVILDNTYQTYKIEDDPMGYFNKNWGMQYNASLQIGYRILPQTFLMIEPVWNSQSGGITQRPYTIEQKYQTLRLNLGIRFVPGSY